jgi:lysozyme
MKKEIDLLKKHEGLRLKPYRCSAGKLTIGYGHNLDDVGISEEEAEMLLLNDLLTANIEVENRFVWFEDLDEVRKAVVVNMIFNLGIARFSAFKKTISLIEEGSYSEAAQEMLDSRWANQVGSRANELSEMMRTGLWPEEI